MKLQFIVLLIGTLLIMGCVSNDTPPSTNNHFPLLNASPYNCSLNTEGHVYANSISNVPCYCNSTDWVDMFNESIMC